MSVWVRNFSPVPGMSPEILDCSCYYLLTATVVAEDFHLDGNSWHEQSQGNSRKNFLCFLHLWVFHCSREWKHVKSFKGHIDLRAPLCSNIDEKKSFFSTLKFLQGKLQNYFIKYLFLCFNIRFPIQFQQEAPWTNDHILSYFKIYM